jgi:anti-repressor protein
LYQNGVDIGRNRLFKWFRENGHLVQAGKRKNHPTQKSRELGLFEVAASLICPKTSRAFYAYTTLLTGMGQTYFMKYFVKSSEQIRVAREKNADWGNYIDRLFDPKYADIFNETERKKIDYL